MVGGLNGSTDGEVEFISVHRENVLVKQCLPLVGDDIPGTPGYDGFFVFYRSLVAYFWGNAKEKCTSFLLKDRDEKWGGCIRYQK